MDYETLIKNMYVSKDPIIDLTLFAKNHGSNSYAREVNSIMLKKILRMSPIRANKSIKSILLGENYRTLSRIINDYFVFCINGSLSDRRYETKSLYEKESDHYNYIPYDSKTFSKILEYTSKENKKNFLDVGSGTGHKPILASIYGDFDFCAGLEYNLTTYERSKDNKMLFNADSVEFFMGDALEYEYYSSFDYIYMYEPMYSEKQMIKLYRKILTDCRIGTLIINVMRFYAVFKLDNEFKFLGDFNPGYGFYLIKTGKKSFNIVNYGERKEIT